MQTTTYGKKQYCTLLALSFIFILLLPLALNLIDTRTYLNSSVQPTMFFLFRIVNIFCTVGSAVSVFAYIRYRFKLCLPFIAVAILSSLLQTLAAILFLSTANNAVLTLSTLERLIFQLLSSFTLAFLSIIIAKTFARHVKNEIAAVSAIFLAMSVLSLLQQFANTIFSYYSQLSQYAGSQTGFSLINSLFTGMPRRLLPFLYNYIYIFVAYLILLAVYDKREKVPIYFSKAKTAIKKLWDKTADEFD